MNGGRFTTKKITAISSKKLTFYIIVSPFLGQPLSSSIDRLGDPKIRVNLIVKK